MMNNKKLELKQYCAVRGFDGGDEYLDLRTRSYNVSDVHHKARQAQKVGLYYTRDPLMRIVSIRIIEEETIEETVEDT